MIIVNTVCSKCGAHILASYNVDVTAKIIFINCANCGALLELQETERSEKNETRNAQEKI